MPATARKRFEEYPKGAQKLILVAERLFGQQGIDNVSLRQIVSAAGQANNYAVQHHFGSKEGLIQAIYDHGQLALEPGRQRHLAAVHAEADYRANRLVAAIFLPILETLSERESDMYAYFVLQLLHRQRVLDKKVYGTSVSVAENVTPTVSELNGLLRKSFPKMPEDVFRMRYRLAAETFLSGLTERKHKRFAQRGKNSYKSMDEFWEDVLQATAAIYHAPYPVEEHQRLLALSLGRN